MSLPDGGNSRVYHCRVHENGGNKDTTVGLPLGPGRMDVHPAMGPALFGLMTIGGCAPQLLVQDAVGPT